VKTEGAMSKKQLNNVLPLIFRQTKISGQVKEQLKQTLFVMAELSDNKHLLKKADDSRENSGLNP
jgi:hypothetical protein